MRLLILVVSGALGTIARYVLSGAVYRIFGTGFPYGTLIVNFVGCLLIGILAALSETKFVLSSNARLFLMIGFCGAFTTFSTFILETSNLLRDGQMIKAASNVFLSVLIGFMIFRLGVFIGKLL